MPNILKRLILLGIMGIPLSMVAQRCALKTNALYDATLSPTLSCELAWNHRYSVDLQASY
ncbi:secreted protein, partial [gut metagenome]